MISFSFIVDSDFHPYVVGKESIAERKPNMISVSSKEFQNFHMRNTTGERKLVTTQCIGH